MFFSAMSTARAVLICAIVTSLAVPVAALAGTKGPIVAVFDIQDKGSGLSDETMSNLLDFLAAELAKAGYRVIPRAQVRERLLDAQKESHKKCYDQSCQIELGRELAAQKTLATKVLAIGGSCQVTAELYDLMQATTDLATTAEARCGDEHSMLAAFRAIVDDLEQPLVGSQQRTADIRKKLEAAYDQSQGSLQERARTTWELTRKLAKDSMVAKKIRVQALQRHLSTFRDADAEIAAEARSLLLEIDPATVTIKSSPSGAEIAIDGAAGGITPLTKALRAGEHRIQAELEGYRTASRELKLSPGQKTECSFQLERIHEGSLVVSSRPSGAWVRIDGKDIGKAPLAHDLPPGEHAVELRRKGFVVARKDVEVAPKERTKIDLRLEPIPARSRMVWGHVSFWSGVALLGLGGVSTWRSLDLEDEYNAGNPELADDIDTWNAVSIAGYAAGGALVVTGAILWILAPDVQSWAERHDGYLGATADANGFVLQLGSRW